MMDKCWNMEPDKRATFCQLKKIVDCHITASKAQDSPYMDLNFVVQEQLRGELCVMRRCGGQSLYGHGTAVLGL